MPLSYIKFLLNSKSNDSLNYYLKKNNWIKDLEAETFVSNNQINLFSIKCILTTEGYKNPMNITKLIFNYL